MGSLAGQDILHGSQFTREELEHVMDVAEGFRSQLA